jgi:hypothetical protein
MDLRLNVSVGERYRPGNAGIQLLLNEAEMITRFNTLIHMLPVSHLRRRERPERGLLLCNTYVYPR